MAKIAADRAGEPVAPQRIKPTDLKRARKVKAALAAEGFLAAEPAKATGAGR
jgi:hypothetical protein